MRRWLDHLYRICGGLAASLTGLIALSVVAQIAGRTVGLMVPGAIEVASFALLGSSFLALAATLRSGEHIRISLVVNRLKGKAKVAVEIWSMVVSATVTGFLALHVIVLCREAYVYNDVFVGVLPIPLWIPYGGMAIGLLVFMIAFVDDLLGLLRGKLPSYEQVRTTLLRQRTEL